MTLIATPVKTTSHKRYIDPQFAQWIVKLRDITGKLTGQLDTSLAIAMTEYLYGDPLGNPVTWDKPETWPGSFNVQWVRRTLNFTSISVLGGTSTQTVQLFGGRNAVVVSRSATVKLTTPPVAGDALDIPNVFASYLTYDQIEEGGGTEEVETQPVNDVFGTVPGQPVELPISEFWTGFQNKVFTLTNNFSESILDANLTWRAAILNTGR